MANGLLRFSVLGASFLFGACANAQPPEAQGQQPNSPLQQYTVPPEDAVEWLVYSFNRKGDMSGPMSRANGVVGANPGNPALAEVEQELHRGRGTFLLSVDNFKSQINGKEATIEFRSTLTDTMLGQFSQVEHLKLKQVEDRFTTRWNVVPGKPEEVIKNPNSGILLRIATFLAFPEETLSFSKLARSQSNLGHLANAYLASAEDNDQQFWISAETFHKDLAPYVKSDQLFFAAESKGDESSYSLNPNIKLKRVHAIQKPSETVMIYEGKDKQLSFAYDGRGLVAFTDGSVKLVTQEEAKSLRWEP